MLDRLNENEQRALMELLIYMAKLDGQVEEIERWLLDQYADLIRVDFTGLEGDLTPEELVPQFQSPASRVIVLQELFRICHLDGMFTAGEQSAILDIASMMGVPMDLLRKIETWVIDGLRWVGQGEALVEEAETVVLDRAG